VLVLSGALWLGALAACDGDSASPPAAVDDAGVIPDDAGNNGNNGNNNGSFGLTYADDILPRLTASGCTVCHGPALQQGGHRLDSLSDLMTTGDHAPAVVPCDSGASLLVEKLRPTPGFGDQMPPGGPYMGEADVAVIARWIDEGAEQGQRCEGGEDVGGDVDVPEELPALIDDRVFRVSARVEMLTERTSLPEGAEGQSAVFAVAGHDHHGYVGAGGQIFRVEREGELTVVPPAWDATAHVGGLFGVMELPDGTVLLSTEVGLLYLSDGALWPSPVSDVLEVVVSGMVAETAFDARGRVGLWMATPRGLYLLVGETLDRLRPQGVPVDAAVGPIALGPSASQAGERAIWAAWGSKLYAITPDASGAMALSFDVDFGAPIAHLAATEGSIWVATGRQVFRRRQGALIGASRWVRWTVPDGQTVRAIAATDTGALWLLTDQALYRTLDDETWQVAVGAPATDVVGLHRGDQDSVWLTRKDTLSWAASEPAVGLAGLAPHDALTFMPDLTIYPTPAHDLASVSVRVDTCDAIELTEAPWSVIGGGAVWSDCLGPGEHTLKVTATFDGAASLPEGRLEVPFAWSARNEQITWHGHIQPMVYGRYCARSGCHVSGFAPDSYASWTEKIDEILYRTESGQMPPNGTSPTDLELLLIRWWREDGFLP